MKHTFDAAVSSSDASTERLQQLGIPVLDLNAAPTVDVYVDGADELNDAKQLIKGGGAAADQKKKLSPVPRSNLFASLTSANG